MSQLADRFVKDAHEVVKSGDVVNVKVLAVDIAKNQISLSMRSEQAPAPRVEKFEPRQREERRPQPPRHNENRPRGSQNQAHNPTQNQAPRRDMGSPQRGQNTPLKIDPNSPFAKLAAIRDSLEKKSSPKR